MSQASKEQLSEELQTTIKEWFQSVGVEGEIVAKVSRISPEVTEEGEACKGYLGEVDMAALDEDFIKRKWGGGRFQLRLIDTTTGKYVKSKNIQIAGAPKVSNGNGKANGESAFVQSGPSDSITAKAMDVAERMAEREREARASLEERLWEKEQKPANDPALDMLRDQLKSQTDEMRELRRQLGEKSPKDSVMEMLIGGRTAEITGLREQHASELRAIRENYESQIRSLNDRFDRQLNDTREDRKRDVERLHEDNKRALNDQKQAYEGRVTTLETVYTGKVDLLKVQLENARGEITQLKNELSTLRAEKVKTAKDSIQEIVAIKEGLQALSGDDDGDDEPATWEKVFDRVADNPVVKGLGERIAGVAAGVPQMVVPPQQQIQAPNPGLPPGLNPEDVIRALEFTENSIRARNTTAADFARAARNMIPNAILNDIVSQGADAFCDQVAGLRPDSAICTMNGRQFMRDVVEALKTPE